MAQNDRTEAMLPVGTILQMGKYRIDGYLASGGFGNTYVVTNLQFDERYALKEFFIRGISERDDNSATVSVSNQTNIGQFEGQREKFKKEARRLRKLHNPYIVGVHDLFEENGTAYYVMDFIDGEALSVRLKRKGKPLKEEDCLDILRQVLNALKEVHELGIWHLDLKPANILVDGQGRAIVIDFGASKQLGVDGGSTTNSVMCYTPGYAPAEQVDQNLERIGPWTDLYALGATLYNMLTCHQPPSVSEIYDGEAFSFPKEVSDKTRYLVKWMMNPRRSQRPQSVDDVQRFLDEPFTAPASTDDDNEATRFVNTNPRTEQAQPRTSAEPSVLSSLMSYIRRPDIKKWAIVVLTGFCTAIGIFFLITMCNGQRVRPVGALGVDTDSVALIDSAVVDTIATESVATDVSERDVSERSREVEEQRKPEEKTKDAAKKEEAEKPHTVTGLHCSFSVGTGTYTGPVDASGRPHGRGSARFNAGGTYRGSFVHGVMSGQGVVRNSNGTFEGTFSGDYIVRGKYVSPDGAYFVGTFSGGQPANGTWYDKDGNIYDELRILRR